MRFRTFIEQIKENYSNWVNNEPVEYAKHLTKTFGQPDELTDSQLCWFSKDGFKRIVIKDEYILHGSPAPHYDFIYCYIDLKVPESMATALAESSGSIMVDYLKGEVGARCGSITANATTLNYCLDAVAGRVTPSKQEYEKRILGMKKMFSDGKKYELDWWPDETKDADPKNNYYAEGHSIVCGHNLKEAEYQGREVKLNKPMAGDVKKSKVFVKDPATGNVKKVNFGDKNMKIKKNIPARRKSFRARHNCDDPGPKTKPRYWSCKAW